MRNFNLTYQDFVFVGIQLVLFIAYILPITIGAIPLPDWVRYAGIGLVLLGALLGGVALLQLNTTLSPFPTPVASGRLITNGAFAIARHPIYTAIIAGTLGYGLFQQSYFKVIVSLCLLILFYFKSQYEERLLSEKFKSYRQYQLKTRRFL